MQKIVSLFLLCLPIFLFAQPKLARTTYQSYDADSAAWLNTYSRSWEYNENDLLIIDEKQTWGNNPKTERTNFIYDENGLLNKKKDETKSINGITWLLKGEGDYFYTASGKILLETYFSGELETYRKEYEYDASENLVEVTTYRICLGETFIDEYILYEYDENNFPVISHYIEGSCGNLGTILATDRVIYSNYSEEGCLTYLKKDDPEQDGSEFTYEYTHYPNSCLVKTSTKLRPNPITDIDELREKIIYFYDESDRRINSEHYNWSVENDSFEFELTWEIVYDEWGNVAKSITTDANGELVYKTEREYTENGRIIYELSERFQPEYELIKVIESELDENGFIIAQDISTIWQGSEVETSHYEYKNFCNGLIAETFGDPTFSLTKRRIIYSYTEIPDCPTENYKPTINLFPNPSNGYFVIDANLMELKNAQIRVFNSTGVLIFQKKLNYHTHREEVDLTQFDDLPNGMYIVKIDAEGESAVEKLLIAR